MKEIIKVENLYFAYQSSYVLEDVNFSIYEGDYVGIIGPNGGGKTTLLKLLMGFLKPDSGTIELLGRAPAFEMEEIGYVPQAKRFDKLFPISVMELVLMGRLSRLSWWGTYGKEDKQAAEKALEMVGLLQYRNNSFGDLSGGQLQRALIARALVGNPKLLLLDEPTANVDTQAEGEIYTILKELNRDMTILMVTHDLHAVFQYVNRVICVQKTAISLKPDEVCEHFAFGLYHKPIITPNTPTKSRL